MLIGLPAVLQFAQQKGVDIDPDELGRTIKEVMAPLFSPRHLADDS